MNAAPLAEPLPLPDDAPHLLLVDDDKRIRTLLARYLGDRGFRVSSAADAQEARSMMHNMAFDLMVLDVMMPGENGLDFAARLRKEPSPCQHIPILMLTARTETADRVKGLEAGVDDYLPKPFDPHELALRIRSILRRTARPVAMPPPVIARFGVFVFDLERGELRQGVDVIRLTDRERDMLRLLASKGGEIVSREELASVSAAPDGEVSNERTVDVQVNRLRRKIEIDPANPQHLQTARGAGYRLLLARQGPP